MSILSGDNNIETYSVLYRSRKYENEVELFTAKMWAYCLLLGADGYVFLVYFIFVFRIFLYFALFSVYSLYHFMINK